MRQLADLWCGSWPRKEPYGFPSASVRHGCHCALLFRLPTVLTWDGCRMPGSGHTRQECGCSVQTLTLLASIPLAAQTISCSRDSVCWASLIYRNARQDKVCHRQRWTAAPFILCIHSREAFAGKRNWHVGRVGIAGLLCHHFPIPFGSAFGYALWLHVWEDL